MSFLSGLPNEVLHLIFQHLESGDHFNISLTSRHIHQALVPAMYESSFRNSFAGHRSRGILFLRTLVECPQIIKHIKSADMGLTGLHCHCDCEPENLQLDDEEIRVYQMAIAALPDEQRSIALQERSVTLKESPPTILERRALTAAILLSFSSKSLEVVSLESLTNDSAYYLEIYTSVDTFARLRHCKLSRSYCDDCWIFGGVDSTDRSSMIRLVADFISLPELEKVTLVNIEGTEALVDAFVPEESKLKWSFGEYMSVGVVE